MGVALAAILIASCGPKQLDRTEAAALLQKSVGLQEPLNWTMQESRFCVFDFHTDAGDKGARLMQQAEAFKVVGLAQVNLQKSKDWNPFGKMSADPSQQCLMHGGRWVSIELTPVGREASKKWTRLAGTYLVTVAVPAVVEVSGITQGADKAVLAEYVWEYRPTDDGKALKFLTRRQTAIATFKLYDDGWRLIDDGTNGQKLAMQ